MTVKTKLHIFYIYAFLFTHLSHLYAQQPIGDSTTSQKALAPVLIAFHKQIGNNLRLYTGAEYIRNGQHALGFPFFQSDTLLSGSIYYDGAQYDNIALQFDLVTGEIITRDTINNASISLIKEKIPGFTLSGHSFVWLPAQDDSNADVKPGYYEQLSQGIYALFTWHEKKMVFPSNKEEEIKYVSTDAFFLRIHHQYTRLEGRHSLLNILKDKKDALRKFIQQNRLDFKHDPGDAYTQILQYYTQLKS